MYYVEGASMFRARVLACLLLFSIITQSTIEPVSQVQAAFASNNLSAGSTGQVPPTAPTPQSNAVVNVATVQDTSSPQINPNGQPDKHPTHASHFSQLPMSFEPNEGQTDPRVHFIARGPSATFFFTADEVAVVLSSRALDNTTRGQAANHALDVARQEPAKPTPPESASVTHIQFLGTDSTSAIISGIQLPGRVNYYRGADRSKWYTNLPTYAGISYQRLYPGINLNYETTRDGLKGTYVIAPGGDVRNIRWRYAGATTVQVDDKGDLQIRITPTTAAQGDLSTRPAITITEQAPVAWQEHGAKRDPVAVRYVVDEKGIVGFSVGDYDHKAALIVDPTITYSTYFGGSGFDLGLGIAVDNQYNTYITGETYSTEFPAQGSSVNAGYGDAFIAKLSADGTTLLSFTYLGGTNEDIGRSIAVSASGDIYVTADLSLIFRVGS
jgi:hypothetical protein